MEWIANEENGWGRMDFLISCFMAGNKQVGVCE
jgi:transcription initiation factor IIF auxiliary subunit